MLQTLTAAPPKFGPRLESFHHELRRRVRETLGAGPARETGGARILRKAVLLLAAYFALYLHLVFGSAPAAIALVECALFGLVTAAIGFNVMHDGGHGSFSPDSQVNAIAGLSLNLLGGNIDLWRAKHNQIHHTYTNVDEWDDDIDLRPWMRLTRTQERRAWHRWQHLYCWFLYAFLYFFWVTIFDAQKQLRRRIGPVPLPRASARQTVSFWSWKALNLLLLVALPVALHGFDAWLAGFAVYGAVTGLLISVVFQLAHAVEGAEFAAPGAEGRRRLAETDWSSHQVRTTANFATGNPLVTWYCGGLNFQIEHHLLPRVSHVHYPRLRPMVSEVCRDHGLPYLEFKTVGAALRAHYRHLREMGRN